MISRIYIYVCVRLSVMEISEKLLIWRLSVPYNYCFLHNQHRPCTIYILYILYTVCTTVSTIYNHCSLCNQYRQCTVSYYTVFCMHNHVNHIQPLLPSQLYQIIVDIILVKAYTLIHVITFREAYGTLYYTICGSPR